MLVYSLSSQMLMDSKAESTLSQITQISQKMDLIISEVTSFSKLVISNGIVQRIVCDDKGDRELDFYKNSTEIQRVLASVTEPRTYIDAAVIYCNDGTVFLSRNAFIPEAKSEQIHENIKTMLLKNDRQFFRSTQFGYYLKDKRPTYTLSVLYPMYNMYSGAKAGLVEFHIEEAFLSKQLLGSDLGENVEVFITDSTGMVIVHNNKELLGQDFSGLPYFNDLDQNDKYVQIFDGEKNFLATTLCMNINGWVVIGYIPLAEIMQSSMQLAFLVFLIGLAWLAVSVITGLFLAKSIAKPIVSLKDTVVKASQGDLTVSPDVRGSIETTILTREFNKLISQIHILIKEKKAEERKKNSYALSALQSQLNPHFLYNTLENITGLVELGRASAAVNLIGLISRFYRNVLSSGNVLAMVSDELDIALNYLKIMNLRYDQRIQFTMNVDPVLQNRKIVKLTLQPILENAIAHGVTHNQGDWLISLVGRVEGQDILFSITDNGPGIPPEKQAFLLQKRPDGEKQDFGLYATHERLQMHFGSEYGLSIYSQPGKGTTVFVRIPTYHQEDEI